MNYSELLLQATKVIDLIAIFILLLGFTSIVIHSLPRLANAYRNHSNSTLYDVFRRLRIQLGQIILLALEVLIVSDIILSILHRTTEEIAILGMTVVIRVGLSYFLNLELDHLNKL